mgnify:CR=1 FL=1
MKRLSFVFHCTLVFCLSGCGLLDIDKDKPNALIFKPGGLFCTEAIIYPIGSAFGSGSIANPNIGISHTTAYFREKYEVYSDIPDTEHAIVYISGFEHTGVTYTEPGQSIDYIYVGGHDVSSRLGSELRIPLNQGIYEGGHELIRSVKINAYQLSGASHEINIAITTKAGDSINIFYKGTLKHDGSY